MDGHLGLNSPIRLVPKPVLSFSHCFAIMSLGSTRPLFIAGLAEPRGFFMPTAVLIDGGFYLRRYLHLYRDKSPGEAARDMHWMYRQHLKQGDGERRLYRIFFYDCPPLMKKAHHPLTKAPLDFSRTTVARWRLAFHDELKRMRKVALRLGYLNERSARWILRPEALPRVLADGPENLHEQDFVYEVRQKGVDMRIGLDIASMTYKKQVDQIVLVAGDSDFVPAAKLARREGVDFVLDPMWASIREDLHEHIDGLRSVFPKKDQAVADSADS